jgi:hypothetical protein
LPDETRRNGQWVKKYKDREISGYWVNHLMCPWIPAKDIQYDFEHKTKQYFENFVMGRAYIGSDVTIDRNVILKCIDRTEPNFLEHNFLGCDSGNKKHYVLGNSQGIFKVGVVDDWEDIEELIKVYDVERCVIDAMPDITEPKKLQKKYPGIVWLCFFKKAIDKSDFIRWNVKERIVQCDRTKIIEQAVDLFVDRKTRIQIEAEDLALFIKHWSVFYKAKEVDALGIERDVWESSDPEDHFALATCYFLMAMDQAGAAQIGEWQKKKETFDTVAPDIQKIIKETQESNDQWN